VDMARDRRRSGQAMVETVAAVLALSLAFFLAARFSSLLKTRLLLSHAAARAARARAVGLNRYMAEKSARVAVIPAAGERLVPSGAPWDGSAQSPAGRIGDAAADILSAPAVSPEASMEIWRIPAYLAAENESFARGILDYALWDRLSLSERRSSAGDGGRIDVSTRFRAGSILPALFGEAPALEGAYSIENHSALYMEDAGL